MSLSASVVGQSGGQVTIASSPGQPVSAQSGGAGVTATLTSPTLGTLSATGCTLDYSDAEGRVSGPPIAPGRIWAHVACAAAMDASRDKMTPDGGSVPVTCALDATFLFENCAM